MAVTPVVFLVLASFFSFEIPHTFFTQVGKRRDGYTGVATLDDYVGLFDVGTET